MMNRSSDDQLLILQNKVACSQLTSTPSVLKYKSFWHFTRFIEHSLNLDKLYVQIY